MNPMQTNLAIGAAIFIGIIALVVGIFVYFVPSFVAFSRRHPHRSWILLLNIFAGWTLFGWIGALVWSLVTPSGGEFDLFAPAEATKSCPRCAERVKRAALVCRYCGYEFGPPVPPPPPAATRR